MGSLLDNYENGSCLSFRDGLQIRHAIVMDVSRDAGTLELAEVRFDDPDITCYNEPGRVRWRDEHHVRLSDGGPFQVLTDMGGGRGYILADPADRVVMAEDGAVWRRSDNKKGIVQWCGHVFTDTERIALLTGGTVTCTDLLDRDGREFGADVRIDQELGRVVVQERS